jgi:APA family basic amino acid/polyamine antiporter
LGTVTGVTLCGIKAGVWFQNACMLIKLAAIAALCLGAWFWFTPTRPVMEAPAIAPGALARGMVAALLPVLFACGGWQMVCYIAPQVKDPKTTLPRAIVLGVIGVVCVYLAINTAYLRVLGIEALATTPNFASEVARATLGPVGGEVLRAAMGISALGVCIVTVVATPFLYVAMAREGLFFERFGVLHPKTGAPTAALLAQLVFALAYWLWGQAELLVDSVVFVEWFFHGLVAIALIRLRRTRPELPRPFKSPLYPLAPLVYILVAIAAVAGNIALAISSGNLRAIWIGGAVLLLGALLYVPWTRWVAHSRAGPPSSA